MATPSLGSFFNKFISLFLLLLHLGCFIFTHNNNKSDNNSPSPSSSSKKRKPSPLSPSRHHLKPQKAWSYLKRIFSSPTKTKTHPSTPTLTSARSSQHSLLSLIPPPPPPQSHDHEHQSFNLELPPRDMISPDSDILTNHTLFPLRNDIFPCTACGEIFQKPNLLEQHQAIKHVVSELTDGESGKNIVNIIFKTGWSNKDKNPIIYRILKIHNSQKILSRFEEYREFVKAKAARNGAVRRRDERCIADGNELLRFYCSTFLCDLGVNGNSSICNQQYCNICGIIKSGFSPKLDGISTLSSSWRAHVAIPEEIEEEFKFMNVKRAMLVCRVVAGRVGCDSDDDVAVMKEDGGFDSVVGRDVSGTHSRLDDEELLVFNPRAVLPCFVIVYTV